MIQLLINLIKYIVAIIIGLFASSCNIHVDEIVELKGDGNIVTENRLENEFFNKISVSNGINVEFSISDASNVTVISDANLLGDIHTEIQDNQLKIYTDKWYMIPTERKVIVRAPNLESIRTSSGSSFKSDSKHIIESITIKASSGSVIKLEAESKNIVAQASSGSSINITGKALSSTLKASSGSNIIAKELETNNTTAKASSGSVIYTNTLLHLEAKSSSGSTIKHKTNPSTLVDSDASSGSKIVSF